MVKGWPAGGLHDCRLREFANIANLVPEDFNGDVNKVSLWFELQNPMLGNISPRNMIGGGRYKRLLNFILDAREAEAAAAVAQKQERTLSRRPRSSFDII